MSDTPTTILPDQFIRISSPDTPVYRIYPLWFLEEALRLKQMGPRRSGSLGDPFEVAGKWIAVDVPKDGRYEQIVINPPPVYAQCWSAAPESDTLLRAYSRVVKDPHFGRNICPRDEGVRVQSTPRKLLEALLKGTQSGDALGCFIGSVLYLSRDALLQQIANAVGHLGSMSSSIQPTEPSCFL